MTLGIRVGVLVTVCTCILLPDSCVAIAPSNTFTPPASEKDTKQDVLVMPATVQVARVVSEVGEDPTLTKHYLQASPGDNVPSQLVIKEYSAKNGLVAGYTSQSGKRILFRGIYLPSGEATIQILHYDRQKDALEHIVGRSRAVSDTQKAVKDVSVAGVDMAAFLRSGKTKSNGFEEKRAQLRNFAASDTGQALLEGVPALMAALEFQDTEKEVKKVAGALGLVAMGLQMASGDFQGIKSIDKILAPNQVGSLRENCMGQTDCTYRGRSFTVTSSGFIDLITKRGSLKSGIASVIDIAKSKVTSTLSKAMALSSGGPVLRPKLMDGDGYCSNTTRMEWWFGYCGYGEFVLFSVMTDDCVGHDLCVCANGQAACIADVPVHCTNDPADVCSSFWDAAASFFEAIWNDFYDWVMSWLNTPPPCVPPEICPGGGPGG